MSIHFPICKSKQQLRGNSLLEAESLQKAISTSDCLNGTCYLMAMQSIDQEPNENIIAWQTPIGNQIGTNIYHHLFVANEPANNIVFRWNRQGMYNMADVTKVLLRCISEFPDEIGVAQVCWCKANNTHVVYEFQDDIVTITFNELPHRFDAACVTIQEQDFGATGILG